MDDVVDEAHRRSARRAFIRSHHPDRGGDPDHFMAGLRRWDEPRWDQPLSPDSPAAPRVWVVPHRAWPKRLAVVLLGRFARDARPPRVR